MTAADRATCRVLARWLAAWRQAFGALGLGAALVAALVMLRPGALPQAALAACAAVLLLALAERVLALRLGFDAGLFADLGEDAAFTLEHLDGSLHALGLRAASARPRALTDRVAGARRLCVQHAGLVLLQCAALAAAFTLAGGAA